MSIKRHGVGPRLSQAVVHGNTVYLAGIVAGDPSADAKGQTEQILKKIDDHLAATGSHKSKLLSATIYVANMALYNDMNAAWDAGWIRPIRRPAPPWKRGSPRPSTWSRSWSWRRSEDGGDRAPL